MSAGSSRFDDSGMSRLDDTSMSRMDDSSSHRLEDSLCRFEDNSSTADDSQDQLAIDEGDKSRSTSPPLSQINKLTAAMLAGKCLAVGRNLKNSYFAFFAGLPMPGYGVRATPSSSADPPENLAAMDLTGELKPRSDDLWRKYMTLFRANNKCVHSGECAHIFKEHFHCNADGCDMTFGYVIKIKMIIQIYTLQYYLPLFFLHCSN